MQRQSGLTEKELARTYVCVCARDPHIQFSTTEANGRWSHSDGRQVISPLALTISYVKRRFTSLRLEEKISGIRSTSNRRHLISFIFLAQVLAR